jgi:hypothetical protein
MSSHNVAMLSHNAGMLSLNVAMCGQYEAVTMQCWHTFTTNLLQKPLPTINTTVTANDSSNS